MIKQSFTLRVLVISFLVLALPLLVDSFIFFQNSYNDAINDAKADLKETANFRTFTLTEIQPVKQVLLKELEYFLKLGSGIDLSSKEMNQKLAEIAHIGENFEIFLLSLDKNEDNKYKIFASSLPSYIGGYFTSFLQLNHIIEVGSGTFIRYIYSDEDERFIPYIFVARLFNSEKTGKPVGLILVTAEIEEQLNTILQPGMVENVKFAVLNSDGIVFAATDSNLVSEYLDPISPKRKQEILESQQLGDFSLPENRIPVIRGEDPPFFEFIFDDQVQIAYRSYISDYGISVLAYSPKEEFFGTAVRHFLFIYSIYGLILVVGGGVTYWLSLWVSRPLRQLSYLMGEVSQGNLDVRFEKEPLGFEINILGEIFNNTLVNLLENIQKAEDERVKKETYQRELAIGRQVQRSLLPAKVPEIPGAEVAGVYLQAVEVGGDFYSYVQRVSGSGEETLVIAVADAAGKGISPCLYSLSARSLFRTYATFTEDPGEIMSLTNNAFLEDAGDTGMFVTMFTGVYHTNSKLLSYYSCGHLPPVVRRADGHLMTLHHSGMALGLKESKGYKTDSIQLQSGDLVIFYTNGLTEAVNTHYQHFSEARLRKCLQQRNWNSAQEAVDGLTAELQAFTGNASQVEEVILVALKID